MTVIGVNYRAAPGEVRQDGDQVFFDTELPGLCVVARSRKRGMSIDISLNHDNR
jgi:hypothetical protein